MRENKKRPEAAATEEDEKWRILPALPSGQWVAVLSPEELVLQLVRNSRGANALDLHVLPKKRGLYHRGLVRKKENADGAVGRETPKIKKREKRLSTHSCRNSSTTKATGGCKARLAGKLAGELRHDTKPVCTSGAGAELAARPATQLAAQLSPSGPGLVHQGAAFAVFSGHGWRNADWRRRERAPRHGRHRDCVRRRHLEIHEPFEWRLRRRLP